MVLRDLEGTQKAAGRKNRRGQTMPNPRFPQMPKGVWPRGRDICLDEMIYEVTIDFPHVNCFWWEDEFSEGVICLLLGGTVRKGCHTIIEV